MVLYAYTDQGQRSAIPERTPEQRREAFDQRCKVISRLAHANTTATILEIVPGVEVWSDPEKLRDADGQPVGGVVLEAHAGASGVDTVTGEIIERPAWYTVYSRYARPNIRRIDETVIDRASVRVCTTLGRAVRELAADLAVQIKARGTRKNGSNILSSTELDLCRYVGALGKVIAGGLTAPVEVARVRLRDEETDDEGEEF